MKSVLISIQPKWCELIASGKKTVEVRKTRPKIETPFKVYIYMTAGDAVYPVSINGAPYTCRNVGGKVVIGDFVCDKIYDIKPHYDIPIFCNQYEYGWKIGEAEDCISFEDLDFYLGGKCGYGWHISDLVIYDKPKKLSRFYHYCGDYPKCDGCEAHYFSNTECGKEDYCYSPMYGCKHLTRPPQSWCYVEEVN